MAWIHRLGCAPLVGRYSGGRRPCTRGNPMKRGNPSGVFGLRHPKPALCWIPHHNTLFQLIDCCFSVRGGCRLCQIIWHGIRCEMSRRRSSRGGIRDFIWHDDELKVALRSMRKSVFLCLKIYWEPWDWRDVNYFYVTMGRSVCRLFKIFLRP